MATAPQVITKKIYKPSMNVGQVYACAYGSNILMPIGNVLSLELAHTEDVQKQPDMTRLGGGTYAEVRRVAEVTLNAKIADWNVLNIARATLSTVSEAAAGTVTDAAVTVHLGALIPLPHAVVSNVVLKVGTDTIDADGNYEVRPEGLFVYDNAPDVEEGDAATLSYSYAGQAVLEAITTKASELRLRFGGLNEADDGKPVIVDIHRASQGVAKTLGLLTGKFGELDVTGTLLADPTKVGAGISRYYRTTMV